MTRSTKTTVAKTVPTIVLKTVHDAIVKANPNTDLTTKKMRVKLRATPTMKAIHTANASWIFTASQADACRALFDPKFAASISRASKRAVKAPAKVEQPADA
jgi:hypothetical protein